MSEKVKVAYPNLPEGFAKEMRRVRIDLGLSGRKLGELIGKGSATVSQYETGQRNINYEDAVLLNSVLNLGFDLPKPDPSTREPVKRPRSSHPIVTAEEDILVIVDGRVLKIVTYRDLGPIRNGGTQ